MAAARPKVVLHWLNGSRAQATLWLLEELKIPYQLDVHRRLPTMLAPPALEKLHPLGKAPLVSVTPPGATEPLVLAESAFIIQYLSDHFAAQGGNPTLIPPRWKPGQEGKLGGETDSWMRYQYMLYYVEGSFMTTMVLHFILQGLKGPPVPFFMRPITKLIANQLGGVIVAPNAKKHFNMLEEFLGKVPDNGPYLCGEHLTGADILLAYPLIAGKDGGFEPIATWEKGSWAATYPKLKAYADRLGEHPGWKKSVQKILEIEGTFSVMPTPQTSQPAGK